MLIAVACTDDDIIGGGAVSSPDDHGIGQLVLFSSGNASNTTSRAAVIPYMEKEGRFVCKMFYHAKATDTDASPFDTISTPITSWLRVNDDEGNSVYWRNDYDMAGVDKSHQDYLDYGFDSRAQYFYWRNRLDHIFLGYCDYNKLKSNTYGSQQGKLFMYPEYDGAKKTKTGEEKTWETANYRKLVFGMVTRPNPEYSADDKLEWEGHHDADNPYPIAETIEVLALTKIDQVSTYPGGSGYYYPFVANYSTSTLSAEQRNATRNQVLKLVDEATFLTNEDKAKLKSDLQRQLASEDELTADGTFHNDVWRVSYGYDDPDIFVADGTSLNLLSPSVAIYSAREKQKIVDVIATAPANTFDLRRGAAMQSMADQPDPLIALTKMKPTGATQEANRVRLYFKHQFSQIQVNLTNADNTAEIKAENIVSVELLGVTEKGYVFTNINPDGTQIPPTYDAVVISKYSEDHLRKNPYGTAFNMFQMADADKPTTSLKSFNAIAFGQLQAIRITWKEEPTNETYTAETAAEENNLHLVADTSGKKPGDDGYVTTYEAGYVPVKVGEEVPPVHHVATYKITVDEHNNSLINLRSGYRYMYDFELRRGTIAYIRATIDPWLLDDQLDYRTDGIIKE